jgi:hypothetical protein
MMRYSSRSTTSRALLFVAALLLVPMATACAQDRDRQTREVGAFTRLSVGVPGTVHLRQGSEHSVEIEARPDVLDQIETRVDGGTLEVEDEDDWSWGDRDVDVYITMPTIERIGIAGSADVVGETPIEGDAIELATAGSGGATLDVRAEALNVRIVGSGTMRLSGTSGRVDAKILGSGDLEGRDLETEEAEIQVMGSGDTELHVTGTLSVRVLGSGDVLYRGRPEVDSSILGSGDVRPLE